MSLNHLLPELESLKDKIPEFILKLYHILQKKEHQQYLTWFGDDQVLIKYPKKFEEKVLPKYFRHKHLSSFIRQLNMYKFSKVSKIQKQKNHMYFKNQNFRRGQIDNLLMIKRNVKKNRGTEQTIQPGRLQDSNSQDVSINQKLPNTEHARELEAYKAHVKASVMRISEIVGRVGNPQLAAELRPVQYICQELLEVKHTSSNSLGIFSSSAPSDQQISLLNYSHKLLPKIQAPLIFPSQCSFNNFNLFNH